LNDAAKEEARAPRGLSFSFEAATESMEEQVKKYQHDRRHAQ
jgi:hypothetical protein